MDIGNLTQFAGLSSTHKEYQGAWNRWKKCRDVISGEDTIKLATTAYLPQPSGMNWDEYREYLARAAFAELTGRARDAMMGLVGRKKPVFIGSGRMEEIAEDVTYTGTTLDDFSFQVLREVLDVGRCGVLVDYPVVQEEELAISDVEEAGLRPYFILYKAEDILDWREGRKGNRKVLTYLKLRETFEEPLEENFYATETVERTRVMRLDAGGKCVFEVFQRTRSDKEAWELVGDADADRQVYMDGKPISFIPFTFFGPFENSPSVQKPPLLAMANLNVHHYQASADRNHALHFCDLPTPVISGSFISGEGEQPTSIRLGPTSAIHLQSDGDAKFLEMVGHGVTPTKELMAEYVMLMSILGNKILASDSKAAEAAETAAIQRAGEQAILAAMANNVSHGLTEMLDVIADYLGEPDDKLVFQLSNDYLPSWMDSQTLIALIGAVTAGKMSEEEFFDALVAGELVRPDKTYAEHKEEIARMPKPAPVTPDSGGTFGVPNQGMANAAQGGADTARVDSE